MDQPRGLQLPVERASEPADWAKERLAGTPDE